MAKPVGRPWPGPDSPKSITEANHMPGFAMRRPRTLVLAGIVAITAAIVGAQAPSLKPTPLDLVTAQVVATLVEHDHLEHPTINDEVSKKWAVNFLKSLDPLKYHFVKADVDEF